LYQDSTLETFVSAKGQQLSICEERMIWVIANQSEKESKEATAKLEDFKRD